MKITKKRVFYDPSYNDPNKRFVVRFECDEIEGLPNCKDFFISMHPVIREGKITDIEPKIVRGDTWDQDTDESSYVFIYEHPIEGRSERFSRLDTNDKVKSLLLPIIQAEFPVSNFIEMIMNRSSEMETQRKLHIKHAQDNLEKERAFAQKEIERIVGK